MQTIRGPRFAAEVPAGWRIERPPRTVSAASPDGPEAVSVGTFRLGKRFRPELWDEAVEELNDVAARLAERVASSGRVVSTRDGTLAARRARVYEIGYRRDGERLLDRVTFLLVGLREYQLTCRIRVDDPAAGEDACALLRRSFRLR